MEELNFSSGTEVESDESMDPLKELCDSLANNNVSSFLGKMGDVDLDEITDPQPGCSGEQSQQKSWQDPLSAEKI